MGKYDRLGTHLRRQRAASYAMSLAHIEGVIGAMLPKSASRPEWWAAGAGADNAPIQCRAWLSAGYTATLDSDREQVRFEKTVRAAGGTQTAS